MKNRTPDPADLIVFKVNNHMYVGDNSTGRLYTSADTSANTLTKLLDARKECNFYFYGYNPEKMTANIHTKIGGTLATILKGKVLESITKGNYHIGDDEHLRHALETSYQKMVENNDPFLDVEGEETHVPFSQGYREQIWKEKGMIYIEQIFEDAAKNEQKRQQQEKQRKNLLGNILAGVIDHKEAEEQKELEEIENQYRMEELSRSKPIAKRIQMLHNTYNTSSYSPNFDFSEKIRTSSSCQKGQSKEPLKIPKENFRRDFRETLKSNLEAVAEQADPNLLAALYSGRPFSYKTTEIEVA